MTEIALVDGTKFRADYSLNDFVTDPPVAGWTYIDEGDDKPKRYFNPANIAYVIEVEESEGPLVEVIG